MVLIMVWVVALLILAAALVVRWTALRLPEAPQCPRCRQVTADTPGSDRLRALVAVAPLRHCTACGWSGRMRWRPAVSRVGTGS